MKTHKINIPARATWAAVAGLSSARVHDYTRALLFEMPALKRPAGVILGSTRATAFAVAAAVRAGHKHFIAIGNMPVNREAPRLTGYIVPKLVEAGLPLPPEDGMPEKDYARFLLTRHFGVPASRVTTFDNDRSTNTGANLRVLRRNGYGSHSGGLEIYTLAGTALRVLMTARKEIHNTAMAISVHNAFPTGVTKENWAESGVARAHMAAEAAKVLGDQPLYVRLGFCNIVHMGVEQRLCRAAAIAGIAGIQNQIHAPRLRKA